MVVLDTGVAYLQFHEKSVKLRLGQGKCALKFNGILGRHHQEGARQRLGLPFGGYLAFLHGFQQGGLRPGGGAVDFVRQHYLGHYRTGTELEVGLFLIENISTGDVRGQQVGRALNAPEAASQRFRQRLRQDGLAQSRYVFQEDMSLAEQGDDGQFHHLALAHDDALHVFLYFNGSILYLPYDFFIHLPHRFPFFVHYNSLGEMWLFHGNIPPAYC